MHINQSTHTLEFRIFKSGLSPNLHNSIKLEFQYDSTACLAISEPLRILQPSYNAVSSAIFCTNWGYVAADDKRQYAYTFAYEVNCRCVLRYTVAKYLGLYSGKVFSQAFHYVWPTVTSLSGVEMSLSTANC